LRQVGRVNLFKWRGFAAFAESLRLSVRYLESGEASPRAAQPPNELSA